MIAVHSCFLKTFCQFLRNRSRAGFLYCTRFIFILIVIESFFWNDLYDRISSSVNNCNCVLDTFYEFFYDYFVFVSKRTVQCLCIIFLIVYNINADAGATTAGFYNNREIHSKFLWSFQAVFFLHGLTCRCRNTSHLEHCLRYAFIHSHSTAQISGSCIRNSHQVKCRLQLTIFSICSMKSQENKIGFLTEFNNIWSEEIFSFFFQFVHLRVEALNISGCFFYIIFCRERIFPVYFFLSTKNIHQDCLMPLLPQSSADSCS